MTLIPFTPFQRLLRQWESTSPQNGAQAMLVDGVLDPDAVEMAWQSTLRDMGLGPVRVEEDEGYSHEIWSGDPPTPLVSHLSMAERPIHEYLQEQMNQPFARSEGMPYRAFAIQRDKQCHLGIVYQQWVADSISIRLLMREWFMRIFQPGKARHRLIDLARPRTLAGPELGWAPRQLAGAAKHIVRWLRQSPRMASFASGEYVGATTLHRIAFGGSELDDVLRVARAEGGTLNDLLIATLATAIAPHLRRKPGDESLAIASSIDLRPYLPGELSETFASLLAYAPVICPLEASNRLDLAQHVSRQTRRLKDPERIAQELALPRLLAWWTARQDPTQATAMFRQHAPVCATIANVNLNKSWLALYYPTQIREYVRVASASPLMPVAVAASTLGDNFDVVISTQSGGLGDDAAASLVAAFAAGLRSLVQSRPGTN